MKNNVDHTQAPTSTLLIAFPSHLRGGAEDYTLAIARGAIQMHWQVLAGFTQRKTTETLRQDFERLGVFYHALEICELGDNKQQAPFIKRITRMYRFLRRHKPDCVLLELPGIQYGLGAMIGAAVARVPLVAVYQLVRDDIHLGLVKRAAMKLLLLTGQHFVAVSEYSRKVLAQKSGLRQGAITVIPNGANLSRFATSDDQRRAQREAKRRELGYDAETTLCITVGRLAPQKGHDLLEKILPAIVAAHPDTRFLWVGDGPLKQRLEAALRQHKADPYVRFLGHRDDVPTLLAASDLFIHPTRFEGLPFSVVEAMAAGTPVVSTRASSIPEVVEHGVSGLLCNVDDAPDLLQSVLHALDHPHEMREMAARARERALQFSEENMVGLTMAVLDSITNKRYA